MKKNVLMVLVAIMAIWQNVFAYNFSAVAPSGQTLYYKYANDGVWVTFPCAHNVPGQPANFYYGYPKPTGALIIPDTVVYNNTSLPVTGIGADAFFCCNGLTSVAIGGNVNKIDSAAFLGCTGMASIYVPNSVVNIGWGPFYDCSGLQSPVYNDKLFIYMPTTYSGDYSIPVGIEEICATAFQECINITSIDIPYTITTIGQQAFFGCSNLHSLNIPSSVDSIAINAFSLSGIDTLVLFGNPPVFAIATNMTDISSTTNLIVSCNNATAYYNAPGWSHFTNITESFLYNFQTGDNGNGFVSILSTPTCTSPAVILASPNEGYQFSQWSDGSFDNPRALTITSDTTIVGLFTLIGSDTVYFHDTTYINVHDTTLVHDTIYLPYYVHDTTTLHDTLYVAVHDTIIAYVNVPVHATVFAYIEVPVHDTVYLPQYIYDTIWLHDTIYITSEGIDGVDALNAKVYSCNGQIVVNGASGNTVTLYDASGRVLAIKQDNYTSLRFDAPVSGTYMIKIGAYPARKVVVIR